MRISIFCFFAAIFLLANNSSAQTESIDEIYIEDESIQSPYRAKANPHVFVRSKKGKSGVNRTPEADAALKHPVKKIALVFTEITEDDAEAREDDNYARWENLFSTYPEFFQHDAEYVSICQCNAQGDTSKFKQVQGFYIYFAPGTSLAASPASSQKTETTEKPVEREAPQAREQKPGEPVAEKKSTKSDIEAPATKKEKAAEPETNNTVAAAEPETKSAAAREPENTNEEAIATDEPEETAPPKPKPAPKKNVAGKPRRALDPRACRPACYGYGDEDLNIFFADNVKLSKKQKKKAKKAPVNLTLQLNPDGTIKKALAQGPNPELNQLVQAATESMNPWNSAVKGGVAVKSQVKMILKLDPGTKALKPSNIITNPRPSPKCKCVSDEEIFGSN